MFIKSIIFLAAIFTMITGIAQYSEQERDSINSLTQLDFMNMKQQLGIRIENRPGPSGNPNDPNAANTNEGLVVSYSLPDPLVTKKGKRITTEKEWWAIGHKEISYNFQKEVYGFVPSNAPRITWTVKSERDTMAGPYEVTEKLLLGTVESAAYPDSTIEVQLMIGLPRGVKKPVPLVLEFGYLRWPFGPAPSEPQNYFASAYEPLWKQQLISQNWGYAVLVPHTIQSDHGAGLTSGIIGLVNKGNHRRPEDWGVLRAWAWGASQAMDYFESDMLIDAQRIGIEGTSRYGKAALVTMAFDSRFSLAFVGSSGAGGASILRRNFGELVENLASPGEYHWFSGNFIKYASILTVNDLPVDAHQLIALCAPRPVFISAGSALIEGNWVDAKGMFLAGVNAGPVYQLLGRTGLGTEKFPMMGKAIADGEIAFRQHAGGHSTGPNWSTWIAWAHRYWDY